MARWFSFSSSFSPSACGRCSLSAPWVPPRPSWPPSPAPRISTLAKPSALAFGLRRLGATATATALCLKGGGQRTRCSAKDEKQDGTQQNLQVLQGEFPEDAQPDELWRFARARWRDPEKALAMYAEHKRWRKAQGDPELLKRIYSKIPFGFVAAGKVEAVDGTKVMLVQGARYELMTAEPEDLGIPLQFATSWMTFLPRKRGSSHGAHRRSPG
ncbi:Peptidyl-prolyl cis-trans isomerase [Durusdinium trenchii]|uniref:Peptidyl-prolyl cis-trans isomerase n=1 Tax=Durusdinium trenchii TaxID=1381693 RepID=A0ABP0SPZ1_9DINO